MFSLWAWVGFMVPPANQEKGKLVKCWSASNLTLRFAGGIPGIVFHLAGRQVFWLRIELNSPSKWYGDGSCMRCVSGILSRGTLTGNLGSIPGLGRSQEEGMATHASILGFPDSSVGKESTCNAEDSGSISGSGRSAGEGISYPLQYSWASLVA